MFRFVSILFFAGMTWGQVPRIWDDAAMRDLELPLARPEYSPKHLTSESYYALQVREIWKSYPVYHPDRAPAGYLDWLRQQEPEQTWPKQLPRTEAEWVRAGELVFDAPIAIGAGAALGRRAASALPYLMDKSWYERVKPPLTREGVLPFYRYVIRKRGEVEIGILSCAMCHTRVMADGAIVKGAQGNFPFDRAMMDDFLAGPVITEQQQELLRQLYFSPWMTPEQVAQIRNPKALLERNPGSMTRHRSHPSAPIGIPDLIGVAQRRYLDRTGLQQNRGVEDLMRYAALNQGGDDLSSFGDFIPAGGRASGRRGVRYSDEQLFALAKYIGSLQHPANPNAFDAVARAGQQVFERTGCGGCHPAPLYTNNKLTPVIGFRVPAEHRKKYDILDVVVGTDPALAMETRRGTGYYKVPSLRGVWNRSALSHTGQVKSLEEWLDPARLVKHKGHEYGLQIKPDEKRALIAFLRTL